MYRTIWVALAGMAALAVGGCSSAQQAQVPASASSSVPDSSAASAAASATAPAVHRSAAHAGSLRVLTEPQAGIGPVYRLISGARTSVDLSMYELADSAAETDLAADAARGVDVRVILDQDLEKSRNTAAYDYLSARRVHVRWGPAGTIYHQKTLLSTAPRRSS